jgi:hypothetical protein
MNLNWLMFGPALVLLFLPVDSLLTKRLKLRAYEHIDFGASGWARKPSAWWTPSLWLDPVRAFSGTWLLLNAWTLEYTSGGWTKSVPFLAAAVLLALATGVQLHTRRDKDALLAPTGYIAGVWLALLSPAVALLALVVAVVGVFAFRTWSAFFFCGAAYAGCAGLWLMGNDLQVPLSAGLAMLPWLAGVISQRTLMQPLLASGHARPAPVREIDFAIQNPGASGMKLES